MQEENGAPADNNVNRITVGRLVEVRSRTWPGINKPGGVGRVSQVHYAKENQTEIISHVDVQYVVGRGKEKRVPVEYVHLAPQYEANPPGGPMATKTTLRDRSLMLGRCTRCGSLRTDCGSCDWAEMEKRKEDEQQPRKQQHRSEYSSNNGIASIEQIQMTGNNSELSSDEEDALFQELVDRNRKQYRAYLRRSSRWENVYHSSSSSDEAARVNLIELSRGRTDKTSQSTKLSKDGGRRSKVGKRDRIETSSLNVNQDQFPILRATSKQRNKRSSSTIHRVHQTSNDVERVAIDAQFSSPRSAEADTHDEMELLTSSSGASSDQQNFELNIDRATCPNANLTSIPLSQFIQPEGEQAAASLPEDTLDLTKLVPFGELPEFFDTTAQRIEEDLVPDARIRIAELEKKVEELDSFEPTTENHREAIENDCQKEWIDLRQNLVRGGIDQCRAAIRKLTDKRLYRRNKNSLTSAQRRRIRDSGIIEARDLRLDCLEDSVQDVMHKIELLWDRQKERLCVEFLEDEESSGAMCCDTMDNGSSLDDENQSRDGVVEYRSSLLPEERELPPFRPHMHAMRAKRHQPSQGSTRKRARNTPKTASSVNNGIAGGQINLNHKEKTRRHSRDQSAKRRVTRIKRNVPSSHRSTVTAPQGSVKGNNQVPTDGRFLLMESYSEASDLKGHINARPDQGASARSLRERGSLRDRIPISERMQKFLDANSYNSSIDSIVRDDGTPRTQPSCHQENTRDASLRSDFVERTSPAEMNHESLKQDNSVAADAIHAVNRCPVTAEQLYLQLRNGSKQNGADLEPSCGQNIVSLCEQLRNAYPNPNKNCFSSFDGIRSLLSRNRPADVSAEFLKTAFVLLQDHGNKTLQELITCDPSMLRIHVRLLVECLNALNRGLGELSPSDGMVYKVLAKCRRHFVDFLVLQLVDSVYSACHPAAWSVQMLDRPSILDDVAPLRDALAEETSLVESACRCIVNRLGCQQWRRGRNNHHLFVSSVCPEAWDEFLRFGVCPQPPESTRLVELGSPLPRIEVETLWMLLAYFGTPESHPAEGRSSARWDLIAKLFATVICSDPSQDRSTSQFPPSDAQISSCVREIHHLSSLLLAGAFDSLPGSDGLVKKLIFRSVSMQADAVASSDRTLSVLPQGADNGIAGSLWKASNPAHFFQDNCAGTPMPHSFFQPSQLLDCIDEQTGLGCMMLPSSPMLRCCLALLSAWMQRVTAKKTRLCRLSKNTAELVSKLVDQALNREKLNRGDSFEAIFTETSTDYAAMFLREAGAYITIIACLFNVGHRPSNDRYQLNALTAAVTHEVWNIMSDNSLKKRFASLVSGAGGPDFGTPTSGILRSFMAAKIMSFVALVQMGVSPWGLSCGTSIIELALAPGGHQEQDPASLLFVVTCIFACVDSLCDLNAESSTMAHAYSFIAVIFTNSASRLASGDCCNQHLRASISRLGKVSPVRFIPTLTKCFHAVTSSQDGSQHDNVQFRALLAAIRGLASLTINSSTAGEPTICIPPSIVAPRANGAESTPVLGDEFWGELDDDVFASLDLGETMRSQTLRVVDCDLRSLWNSLARSVDSSKPSKRFAISGSAEAPLVSGTALMSVHGKALVGRHAERICDCLVAFVALDDGQGSDLGGLFAEILRQLTGVEQFVDDFEDSDYCSSAANRLCSSLCLLARFFHNCRAVVYENSERILWCLIDSLADSNSLERFPSCNLGGVRANGGDDASERARLLLNLLSGESSFSGQEFARLSARQRIRQKKAEHLWSFCHDFGRCLSDDSATPKAWTRIGAALLQQEVVARGEQWSNLHSASMEFECVRRFSTLRLLISSCGRCDTSNFISYERLCSFSVATASRQLLRIAQSLQYYDRSYDAERGKAFRRAQLMELLSTWSVTTVALFSWTLRETRALGSKQWGDVICKIRDHFITQLLQRRLIDVAGALSEIIEACLQVIGGLKRTSKATKSTSTLSGFISGEVDHVVQRSRQLFVHITRQCALGKSPSLVNPILLAVTGPRTQYQDEDADAAAWAVACSFQVSGHLLRFRRRNFQSSMLERAIGECLNDAEQTSPEGNISLKELKEYALRSILLPQLNHINTTLNTKRRTLLLIGNILEVDTVCECSWNLSTVELDIFCHLAKGICSSLSLILTANPVDNDAVATVFACVKHLTKISVRSCNGTSQALIQWSREKRVEPISESGFPDASLNRYQATFLWVSFGWLLSIGRLIADLSSNKISNLAHLRNWCRQRSRKIGSEDSEALDLLRDSQLMSSESSLICLEKIIFHQKPKNNPRITNVYARTKIKAPENNIESLDTWDPSGGALRRAKEYVAEMIPMRYQAPRLP